MPAQQRIGFTVWSLSCSVTSPWYGG